MKIGPFEINRPIALAPMEDVTDIPYRIVCKRLGADLVYTEFTSSEAIIRDAPKALKKITIIDEERPVAIQIYGGVEESMEKAAKIAEGFQPDFIDINCGCWVKNHALRGEGAGLLRDLNHFERVVKSTVKATDLPVTIKTRLGWDDKSIVILDVAKMLEQTGVHALTVHCRTRCQGYKGQADWHWLEKLKKTTSIPIIGNGDLMTPQDIKLMFNTGCDGVMVGRGAIANPWIFQEAKYYLKYGKLPPQLSVGEKINVCIDHLKLSVQYNGPYYGVINFRKYYSGYLRGLPFIAKLRSELMKCEHMHEVIHRLYSFQEQYTANACQCNP